MSSWVTRCYVEAEQLLLAEEFVDFEARRVDGFLGLGDAQDAVLEHLVEHPLVNYH